MNRYEEYKYRRQAAVNALPIMFAFSDKQFAEGMKKLGLSPDDTDKVYKFGGTGGFYRKTDADLIHKTFEDYAEELDRLIREDTTGEGFIKDMFVSELANNEYCITYDYEETLDACGFTADDILNNKALANGLYLARQEYLKSCGYDID